MRITRLRGSGVAWLKCTACRLKASPSAVGADGHCPRCGHTRMLKLSFGGRFTQPTENVALN
jgi:DNA-directed RNA polymerase subunit RPC12/RpoP